MKFLIKCFLFYFCVAELAYGASDLGIIAASQGFLEKIKFGRQAKEVVSKDTQPKQMFAPKNLGAKAFKVISTRNASHLKKVQFNTSASISVDMNEVAKFIKNYLDKYSTEFKVNSSDLSESPAYQGYSSSNVYSVVFGRKVLGFPVNTAFIEFNFSVSKQPSKLILREILNQSYGDIVISNSGVAPVSETQLKSIVGLNKLTVESEKIVINPVLRKNRILFLKATQYVFSAGPNSERYFVSIIHGEKEILEASSLKYNARNFLRAKVLKRNYLTDDTVDISLPRVNMTIGGNDFRTEADGSFDQELPFEAIVTLKNDRVDITPANSRQTIGVRTTVGDKSIQSSGDDFTALNAFTAINRVNQFVRRFVAPSETSYLGAGVRLRINVSEGTCNAYYNGEISMYREGGGCANMSRVNDVMYHEWGHGLDDYTGRNMGIRDDAFSEGIGDIVSAYMTDSPNMGAGFFQNSETGIRNLDNTKRYPQDQGEVHDEGEIIGGAFWDLREALIERHGEVKGHYIASYLFFRHLLIADSYRESFDQVVKLDDDDGNPATRSPNFCLIVDAFKAHGLADDASCDDVVEEGQTVDGTVFIGLKEINGQEYLIASAASASSVYICRSDDPFCGEDKQVKMKLEGELDSKLFFISEQPFTFSNHLIMTAVVKDTSGSIAGVRRFKAVGR